MANIKLDSQRLAEGPLVVARCINGDFIAKNQELVKALPLEDNNKAVETFQEGTKTMQTQYNDLLESYDNWLAECGKLFDLAEYYEKKATVGEVSKRSTSFEVKKQSHKKAGF